MKSFISGLSTFLQGKKTYLALGGLCLMGVFYPQIESRLGAELTQGIVVFLAGVAGLSKYLAVKRVKKTVEAKKPTTGTLNMN